MKIFAGIIFSISLLLTGCGGGGGGGIVDPNTSAASTDSTTMSLENVNQLMVAPVGLTASTVALNKPSLMKAFYALLGIQNAEAQSTVSNQVYTIGSNGVISPSRVAEIIAGRPTKASSNWVIGTPKFSLISYTGLYKPGQNGENSLQCVLVGVRYSDGLLSCINLNPRCDAVNACDVTNFLSQIKVDPSGDIFFIVAGDGGLYKLDLTNPLKPVISTVFTHADVGDAQNPVINSTGDVLVSINILSSENVQTRIYSSNGKMTVISDPQSTDPELNDQQINCAFPGFGDHSTSFYYLSIEKNNPIPANSKATLYEMLRNTDGTFKKVKIKSSLLRQDDPLTLGYTNCAAIISQANRSFAIGYKIQSNVPNRLYELANPSNVQKIYSLSNDFDSAVNMKSCTTGLAILGVNLAHTSNGIDKFLSSTNVVSNVLRVGKYSIESMAVSNDCTITFVGVRLSDKVNVKGKIDPSDNLSITILSASATSIANLN